MDQDESKKTDKEQDDYVENNFPSLREYASPACYLSEFEEDFDGEGLA